MSKSAPSTLPKKLCLQRDSNCILVPLHLKRQLSPQTTYGSILGSGIVQTDFAALHERHLMLTGKNYPRRGGGLKDVGSRR
jgi:hypothetical protein